MTPAENPMVQDYMNRLRAALSALPEARRDEITEAFAQHIAEAWSEFADESEAAIQTMLDHLGEPEEIAADALEVEQTATLVTPRRREARVSRRFLVTGLVALVLLVGGVVGGLVLSGGSQPINSGPPITFTSFPSTTIATSTVPNVLGVPADRATMVLETLGLRVMLQSVPATSGVPAGLVARQTPPAGAKVAAGAVVEIAVAAASSSSTTTTFLAPTTTTTR